MNFFKFYNIDTQDMVYFTIPNTQSQQSPKILNSEELYKTQNQTFQREQITYIDSGILSTDRLFYLSPLHKAVKTANHLELIEESIVVFRFNNAPDRKAFYIDTGRLPPKKADAYLQKLRRKNKSQIEYDTSSGTITGRKKTIPLLQDWWFPVNADGRGTKIENVSGTGTNLSEIEDLEYFLKKLYKSLNVPLSRRQQDSELRSFNKSNLDIEVEELKFNKFTQKLRKKFKMLFLDLMEKELISTKTFTHSDWLNIKYSIQFKFNNINDFTEAKKLSHLEDIMDVASNAEDLREKKYFSKQWIKENILMQSEEEIKLIKEQIEQEKKENPDEEDGY